MERKRRAPSAPVREALTAYLFLAPALVVIGLFGLVPLANSLVLSLFRWGLRPGQFVGLDQYFELFGGWGNLGLVVVLVLGLVGVRKVPWGRGILTGLLGAGLFLALALVWDAGDSDFLRSLQVTVWFALGTVPAQMVFGLALALALDAKFSGRQGFRVLFLVPYIVPMVASAGVFGILFSLRPESWANQVLHTFGLGPWQWLREPRGIVPFLGGPAWNPTDPLGSWLASWVSGPTLALVCILGFNCWVYSGYYALVFANGLAAIPREIYDAARIDGARKPAILFRITLPLLSPTSYFLLLMGVIGTFKAFNSIYVLRNPATGGGTDPASVDIFFTFFRELRYGYASAQALVLFGIVLAVTLFLRRFLDRKVFYG